MHPLFWEFCGLASAVATREAVTEHCKEQSGSKQLPIPVSLDWDSRGVGSFALRLSRCMTAQTMRDTPEGVVITAGRGERKRKKKDEKETSP